jgi:probable HAF family extracellular repeat protein
MKSVILASGVAAVTLCPLQAQKYHAQVISNVEGGYFMARALNNSTVRGGVLREAGGLERGYLAGTNFSNGLPPGSEVNGLANQTWAVGSFVDTNQVRRAFLYWFRDTGNYLEDLSFFQAPGYGASSALGVSEDGHVTGWIETATGDKRAFTYFQGHFTVTPAFDASQIGVATDGIHVFGNSTTASGLERGFVWESNFPGDRRYLPTFGGAFSKIHAVAGIWLAGEAQTATGTTNAFVVSVVSTNLLNLRTLGGATSRALGINMNLRVVGQSEDAQGRERAFLYYRGTLYDLNDLLDAPGVFNLTSAFAINDADAILAEGTENGMPVQFYLTLAEPFPHDQIRIEPNSVFLSATGPNFGSISFFMFGPPATNYVVQMSSDLKTWEDYWARPTFHETPVGHQFSADQPQQFFRVRQIDQ